MSSHQIRRVRSGIEDDVAWVSIWFRTEARNLEVLHIVCGKTIEDSITGHLYMERYDQAVACYGGAEKITICNDVIDLQLNKKGTKSLMLEASLALVVSEALSGWKKAVRVFQEMSNYPTGHVIEMV
jgi:Immunity protein 10